MTEPRHDPEPFVPETAPPGGGIHYPTNTVLGVVESPERLASLVAALRDGGFAIGDIRVATGAAMADAVHAVTGRSGLAGLAVRIAEKLGAADEEMEFKEHYEQAMRDGRFVVMVSAANGERKDRARDLLREHGADALSFHGRVTIEGDVPYRDD
jgi:hypothetical protein